MTEFDLRKALQQLVDSCQFQGNTIDFLQAMDQVLGYFKTPLDETSKLHFCLKGLHKDMRDKVLLKSDGSKWQLYTELRAHLLKIASMYDREQVHGLNQVPSRWQTPIPWGFLAEWIGCCQVAGVLS